MRKIEKDSEGVRLFGVFLAYWRFVIELDKLFFCELDDYKRGFTIKIK